MPFADIVIEDANVLTMNDKQPFARSVAIKGNKIICVSNNVNDLIGKQTRVINANGKAVVPGFIDTHVHLVNTALSKLDDFDMLGIPSLKDFLEAVKKIRKPTGLWIRVRGFDDSMVMEGRYPTRWELDQVSPNNPLILKRLDGHSCVVNTLGLNELNIPEDTLGFERDSQGRITGVLRGKANEIARLRVEQRIPRDKLILYLKQVSEYAVSKGVTTIHALDGVYKDPSHILLLQKMKLPVDLVLYYQTINVSEVISMSLPRIGGCLLVDGSMDSHTAAFFDSYSDNPDTKGILYFTNEKLRKFILNAHKSGLQIAMHAIGDKAIEQLIDGYEYAIAKYPREDHRHRIEHAEVPTREQLERMKKLKLSVGVQPAFLYYWDMDKFYKKRLGCSRAKRLHPYRRMIDSDLLIAGGSDSPVTPMDPILGIHAAVNHPVKGSSINVMEAIKLFTINGAKIAFEDREKGSIEVGKKADLLILSEDPLKVPRNRLKEIKVEKVIKNGKIIR